MWLDWGAQEEAWHTCEPCSFFAMDLQGSGGACAWVMGGRHGAELGLVRGAFLSASAFHQMQDGQVSG